MHHRSLRFESLEIRQLLSVTVNTLIDEADGSITDGDISLRDALALAPHGETIDFDPALFSGGPATLQLLNIGIFGRGQLALGRGLTIDGPGSDLLTIRAYDPTPEAKNGDGSGVIDAIGLSSIQGVTLSGGDTNYGGGIFVVPEANTTLRNVAILGNSAGTGGGIYVEYAASVSIIDSRIEDNIAGNGGGISTVRGLDGRPPSSLTITGSIIRNNNATGPGGYIVPGAGGGLAIGDTDLLISDSEIVLNSATDSGGGLFLYASSFSTITDSWFDNNTAVAGGGILNYEGVLMLHGTTISSNMAQDGAGIKVTGLVGAEVTVSNSTISGNIASMRGGGLSQVSFLFPNTTTIRNSTITRNLAPVGMGAGIFSDNTFFPNVVELQSTIVAENQNGDLEFAVGGSNPFVSQGYNLVGFGNGSSAFGVATNDLVGIPPLLGMLADNGGVTITHALQPGSPAINAGNPSDTAGGMEVPEYDQRGVGFSRVENGRIDIGAFEVQGAVAPSADFDGDGDVDGRDFLFWQRGHGTANAMKSDGDADSDFDVDGDDLNIWQQQYGNTEVISLALAESDAALMAARPTATDAALTRMVSWLAFRQASASDEQRPIPSRNERIESAVEQESQQSPHVAIQLAKDGQGTIKVLEITQRGAKETPAEELGEGYRRYVLSIFETGLGVL